MTDRPDYSPTAVDVVLRPEWAAREGTDKSFSASGINLAFGEFADLSYVVPAGKTLVITTITARVDATLAADGDSEQHAEVLLRDVTAATQWINPGVNGGFGLSLNRPIRVPAGHTYKQTIYSRANHNVTLRMDTFGYEE